MVVYVLYGVYNNPVYALYVGHIGRYISETKYVFSSAECIKGHLIVSAYLKHSVMFNRLYVYNIYGNTFICPHRIWSILDVLLLVAASLHNIGHVHVASIHAQ